MERKQMMLTEELLKQVRCKFCKSDDLSYIPDMGLGPYVYHYSLDYELGCKQRITPEQLEDNLEIKCIEVQ